MKAYLIEANNKVGRGRWTDFDQDALDPGSVTIQTAYAGVPRRARSRSISSF